MLTKNFSFYNAQLFFSLNQKKTSKKFLAPSSMFSTIPNSIVTQPKNKPFRICSKKVFLEYNLPDNVSLNLLQDHIEMSFTKFGLCSWLIASGGESGMASKNQKNIYIFLKCERKVDIENPKHLDFFFDHKIHRGIYNSARSEDMCIESCLDQVFDPLDKKTLLCSPDILVLLAEKPYLYNGQLFFSLKKKNLAPSSMFSTIPNSIVTEPKNKPFRICSKKVLLKYTLPDNVPLTLLQKHIEMLFTQFGLCSWLIASGGEGGMASKNQKNIYIFLKCERKVDIENPIYLDFFFNSKLHRGIYIYNSARSEDMCIESCLCQVFDPLDKKTLLCSPDILVLLAEKPYLFPVKITRD